MFRSQECAKIEFQQLQRWRDACDLLFQCWEDQMKLFSLSWWSGGSCAVMFWNQECAKIQFQQL